MSLRIIGRELLSRFPLVDGLFRRFVWSRVFFPENEMRFLNALETGAIDIALDVGAATGSYSWILNRVSNRVYAFEPGKVHYKQLARVAFNSHIKLVHAAVGSDCGRLSLYTPGTDEDALHSATLSQHNPVVGATETLVEEVDVVTLDSFISENLEPRHNIDLLKVDVEGYELEVFRGATETIARHHPLILCEIEARHNAGYGDTFKLLRDMGYICYIFRNAAFERFSGERIEELQTDDDLRIRLGRDYDPMNNRYINNFVFQHPQSRIKVEK